MLFKDVKSGDCISLPDGGLLHVTTGPESDDVTGSLFITGMLQDGSESRYYANVDDEVKSYQAGNSDDLMDGRELL